MTNDIELSALLIFLQVGTSSKVTNLERSRIERPGTVLRRLVLESKMSEKDHPALGCSGSDRQLDLLFDGLYSTRGHQG